MPPFVGRQAERSVLADALGAARVQARAVTVAIEGPAGIGKSALLEAFLDNLPDRADVTRLQARRLERAIDGSFAERLPDAFIVFAIDDAHWIDAQSLRTLARLIERSGSHPALVIAAYDDEHTPFAAPPDRQIVLTELSDADTRDIARGHAPALSSDVIDAIVARAHGIPFDAVTLAWTSSQRAGITPGELDASGRRAIARYLAELTPAARAFAQTLSLFATPAPQRIVDALWPDARDIAAAISPALLREDGQAFAFTHALAAAAVSETIAMKIPLHRRITAAIERSGVSSLTDRFILAEQTLESGDRASAQQATLELAFAAEELGATQAVLWASERHLEGGEPPDERFVAFYAHFLTVLMERGEFARAEAIASHGLSEAQRRDLRGAGVLAGQLVAAQWRGDRREAARTSFDRYLLAFKDSSDARALREAAPWVGAT
ncbi:MAG TPA: AAA family ATPase [Candidatus Aquilonibacter sp.]